MHFINKKYVFRLRNCTVPFKAIMYLVDLTFFVFLVEVFQYKLDGKFFICFHHYHNILYCKIRHILIIFRIYFNNNQKSVLCRLRLRLCRSEGVISFIPIYEVRVVKYNWLLFIITYLILWLRPIIFLLYNTYISNGFF